MHAQANYKYQPNFFPETTRANISERSADLKRLSSVVTVTLNSIDRVDMPTATCFSMCQQCNLIWFWSVLKWFTSVFMTGFHAVWWSSHQDPAKTQLQFVGYMCLAAKQVTKWYNFQESIEFPSWSALILYHSRPQRNWWGRTPSCES